MQHEQRVGDRTRHHGGRHEARPGGGDLGPCGEPEEAGQKRASTTSVPISTGPQPRPIATRASTARASLRAEARSTQLRPARRKRSATERCGPSRSRAVPPTGWARAKARNRAAERVPSAAGSSARSRASSSATGAMAMRKNWVSVLARVSATSPGRGPGRATDAGPAQPRAAAAARRCASTTRKWCRSGIAITPEALAAWISRLTVSTVRPK